MPTEEGGRGKRSAREDHPVLGAMRQDQPLVGPEEHHVMIARDRAAAQARETDRTRLAIEPGPVAAALGLQRPTAAPSRRFAKQQRRS